MALKRAGGNSAEDERTRISNKKRGGLGSQAPGIVVPEPETVMSAKTRQIVEEKMQQLDEAVSQSDLSGPIDESKLRKMLLSFEKRMLKNQELRIKFPDDPRKDAISEIYFDLADSVDPSPTLELVCQISRLVIELCQLRPLEIIYGHRRKNVVITFCDLLTESYSLGLSTQHDHLSYLLEILYFKKICRRAAFIHSLQNFGENQQNHSGGLNTVLSVLAENVELLVLVSHGAGVTLHLSYLLETLYCILIFYCSKSFEICLIASSVLPFKLRHNAKALLFLGILDGHFEMLIHKNTQYPILKLPNLIVIEQVKSQRMCKKPVEDLCQCKTSKGNTYQKLHLSCICINELRLQKTRYIRIICLKAPTSGATCNSKMVAVGRKKVYSWPIAPARKERSNVPQSGYEETYILHVTKLPPNCCRHFRTHILCSAVESNQEK
ncbi:unnamed protein product, partial [Meganyctiphanes norvegica]